jgi:hypothetical protein
LKFNQKADKTKHEKRGFQIGALSFSSYQIVFNRSVRLFFVFAIYFLSSTYLIDRIKYEQKFEKYAKIEKDEA